MQILYNRLRCILWTAADRKLDVISKKQRKHLFCGRDLREVATKIFLPVCRVIVFNDLNFFFLYRLIYSSRLQKVDTVNTYP